MTRWRWYWTHAQGWAEFERAIEGGGKWALLVMAIVAVCAWLANGAPTP